MNFLLFVDVGYRPIRGGWAPSAVACFHVRREANRIPHTIVDST
jgi:hypothetical protein